MYKDFNIKHCNFSFIHSIEGFVILFNNIYVKLANTKH